MNQQELELLAEWMGIEGEIEDGKFIQKILLRTDQYGEEYETRIWNPSPEGNDTDFLNMVAGRVVFLPENYWVTAYMRIEGHCFYQAQYADHNNDKLAAMKHAAYQVCLMAAREWKEGKYV